MHLVCALAALLSSAFAQDVSGPTLLVATPELRGPYQETVLIAVPLAEGHFGFILNRETGVKLSTLFPEHAPSTKVQDPVYFGGPELSAAIFAVLRRNPGPGSLHLFGDVYLTGKAADIDRIIERRPNEARYFAALVHWTPAELTEEIQRGFWLAAKPEASFLFDMDAASMWSRLINRIREPLTPVTDRQTPPAARNSAFLRLHRRRGSANATGIGEQRGFVF
jgi:putative AlgH/UPF0301 family transcriptional regulator